MVLMPGCGCCVSFTCPRPCASQFRYISVRFQHAAGSGNPIVTTLPVDVIDYSVYPIGSASKQWSPPDVPSTVSFDAVDETIVIDTFETPGYTISGAYSQATVGGLSACFSSVSFSRQVEIGQWRTFNETQANQWSIRRPFYERVEVSVNLPWISPQSNLYDVSTGVTWNTRLIPVSAQYSWTRTQTPVSGSECTSPTSWGQSSLVSSGVAHLGEFTKPGYSDVYSIKYFVPYSNYGTNGVYGSLETYSNYSGLPEERLVWRRLLPDPTTTISVS